MHIHMITQLSTHLCCHGTELMKRTKERERYTEKERERERVGGRKCGRNGQYFSTIFYSVVKDEYQVCCLCLLRCHTNLPSTLTPPTPSVQVSYCAAVTEAIDDPAATFENIHDFIGLVCVADVFCLKHIFDISELRYFLIGEYTYMQIPKT